ncbi:MAG TPA: SpoIIE family protein phosphatase, partial [Haliangiales bacterium]|nr:SpoIIE family protein phosphatase [Haliangiales bacterium]
MIRWATIAASLRGPTEPELREAQAKMILERTVVIGWVAFVMIPLALLTYSAVAAPAALATSAIIVVCGVAATAAMMLLTHKGVFARHPHLAMFLLVGCVFGAIASHNTFIVRAAGGYFFLSFFLIGTALATLFPANVGWTLLTYVALAATYLQAHVAYAGLELDTRTKTDLLYLFYLAVLGAILNRIVCRMFFDERRATAELRRVRDALFSEMEVAREIQTLLVPRTIELPGCRVAGAMVPAASVGGDYYDVLHAGGRKFVAVGDVSGHGVTTGLTMMMARASLLGVLAARPDAPLGEVYGRLNECLRRTLERTGLRLYMTLALVEAVGGGRFRAVGAHLPVLVRRAAGAVEEIALPGVWLGVVDAVAPDAVGETEIALRPGDALLLYTDGVVERMNGDEIYGWDRLRAALAAAPA